MLKTQPMADSRDMFVVHDMFRRQFKAIPGLVSEVPAGDAAQVAIVAGHVAWMVTFLHAHHEGEDLFVWPKLLERIPVKIDPLILTMEAQHEGLAQALDDLAAKAASWRTTSAAPERDALAGAATELLVRIAEHLGLEEREVLPLIDKYLTEKEWQKVGGSGLKKMSFGQLKVAFGMILGNQTKVTAYYGTLWRTVVSTTGTRTSSCCTIADGAPVSPGHPHHHDDPRRPARRTQRNQLYAAARDCWPFVPS